MNRAAGEKTLRNMAVVNRMAIDDVPEKHDIDIGLDQRTSRFLRI